MRELGIGIIGLHGFNLCGVHLSSYQRCCYALHRRRKSGAPMSLDFENYEPLDPGKGDCWEFYPSAVRLFEGTQVSCISGWFRTLWTASFRIPPSEVPKAETR